MVCARPRRRSAGLSGIRSGRNSGWNSDQRGSRLRANVTLLPVPDSLSCPRKPRKQRPGPARALIGQSLLADAFHDDRLERGINQIQAGLAGGDTGEGELEVVQVGGMAVR